MNHKTFLLLNFCCLHAANYMHAVLHNVYSDLRIIIANKLNSYSHLLMYVLHLLFLASLVSHHKKWSEFHKLSENTASKLWSYLYIQPNMGKCMVLYNAT